MIIDVHHHYVCEAGYLDGLLRQMDALRIERCGLMAMGAMFERLFVRAETTVGPLDERDLLAAMTAHPDRFFGYVYIRLGCDGPDKVRQWGEQGFRGVKFHIPRAPYCDESFFPVYEAARDLGLVCLFHTGLIGVPFPRTAGERISSEFTRPVQVEPIVWEFPDLRIILAHMGNIWAEEVAGLMRLHESVFADVSGRIDGWRTGKPLEWFRELLFWPGAERKLLFGSDVHYAELTPTVAQQLEVVRGLGWGERGFLYDNAARLFGFS